MVFLFENEMAFLFPVDMITLLVKNWKINFLLETYRKVTFTVLSTKLIFFQKTNKLFKVVK